MLSNINKILCAQSIINFTTVQNNICKSSKLKAKDNLVNFYNKVQMRCFSVLTKKRGKQRFSFVGNNVQKQNYSEENRRKAREKFKCKDGYRVVEWNDNVIPQLECKPCAPKMTDAPRLKKPRKRYDDSKLELPKCPSLVAEKCAERLDDLINKKKIMPLTKLNELGKTCEPCSSNAKKDACPLKRPRPYYDASKMDRVICVKKTVVKCAERLDDVTGILKEKHKKKVLMQLRDDCRPKPEVKLKPVGMKRLPKFEPKDRDPCPVVVCHVDPPRLDDVLCWRPTRKILPKL